MNDALWEKIRGLGSENWKAYEFAAYKFMFLYPLYILNRSL